MNVAENGEKYMLLKPRSIRWVGDAEAGFCVVVASLNSVGHASI